MKRFLYYLAIIPALFLSGVMLWVLSVNKEEVPHDATPNFSRPSLNFSAEELRQARRELLETNGALLASIQKDTSFGDSKSSILVGTDIFGDSKAAVEDVRDKTEIVGVDDSSWLIRFPIVNVVLVETRTGLVLIDTGYKAAGPVLLETIRELSDKPIHTVIYTHGHVDHAYGLHPIIAAGERPEIIAHKNLPPRFDRYLKTRGSLSRSMSQPLTSLPQGADDLIYPSRVFDDRLEIYVGGELFVLQHYPSETDDQLYVWIPGRGILASADYYQGFLPNAGNGLRVQRYPEQWALALREMASLNPTHMLPGHGPAMLDATRTIQNELNQLASALESIAKQTLDNLNRGMRRDIAVANVDLPPALRKQHSLREVYVSPQDIAKMIAKQYTGWWDGIPSHWSPASHEEQAKELAYMAGGVEVLAERAMALIEKDIRLAAHLADWAWSAEPSNKIVQKAVLDVYSARAVRSETNSMERSVYLRIMTEAKAYQLYRD